MKPYTIHISISGTTPTLDFVSTVMELSQNGNDFINQSMDLFRNVFEDDPHISSMMVSGTCELTSIEHHKSTLNLYLVSTMPVPFGWLHAFSYAFKGVAFTVYTTDESGAELILLYDATHYNNGG